MLLQLPLRPDLGVTSDADAHATGVARSELARVVLERLRSTAARVPDERSVRSVLIGRTIATAAMIALIGVLWLLRHERATAADAAVQPFFSNRFFTHPSSC